MGTIALTTLRTITVEVNSLTSDKESKYRQEYDHHLCQLEADHSDWSSLRFLRLLSESGLVQEWWLIVKWNRSFFFYSIVQKSFTLTPGKTGLMIDQVESAEIRGSSLVATRSIDYHSQHVVAFEMSEM